MHRLPPFPGLVAFDAVLRHASVTRAAAELGLTQSAVSHRLRGLEDYFGAPLLERLNPGLRPTPAGERLAQDLAPLLGTLAGLRERVAGGRAPRPFRIGVGNALLAWWLSPRLPDLAAAFPAVAIEVTTRENNPWDGRPGTVPEETDLALLWIPRERPVRAGLSGRDRLPGRRARAAPRLSGPGLAPAAAARQGAGRRRHRQRMVLGDVARG